MVYDVTKRGGESKPQAERKEPWIKMGVDGVDEADSRVG